METSNQRVCRACGQIPRMGFYQHRRVCKSCYKENVIRKRRTHDGLITTIYANQRQSSKRRGLNMPSYSKHRLRERMFSNGYEDLFNEWVSSGYDTAKIPSVDRIDPSMPYEPDNIQLMTWEENYRKSIEETSTPVRITKEFESQAQAAEFLGVSNSAIAQALVRGTKSQGYNISYI